MEDTEVEIVHLILDINEEFMRELVTDKVIKVFSGAFLLSMEVLEEPAEFLIFVDVIVEEQSAGGLDLSCIAVVVCPVEQGGHPLGCRMRRGSRGAGTHDPAGRGGSGADRKFGLVTPTMTMRSASCSSEAISSA